MSFFLRLVIVGISLIGCFFSNAQQSRYIYRNLVNNSTQFKSGPQTKRYVFTRFTTSQGLASNIVSRVTQDRNGFIWFATINGLQRYDGHSFITFRKEKNNPNAIPHDYVGFVYVYENDELLIATADNKVGIFNTKTFRYRELKVNYHQPPPIFLGKAFVRMHDGRMLMYVHTLGNYVLDKKTQTFNYDTTAVPKPANWPRLNHIHYDTNTRHYWMSTDSGLAVYNPQTKNLNYHGHNPDQLRAIDVIGHEPLTFSIQNNGHKEVLYSTWPKNAGAPFLNHVDLITGKKRRHVLSNEIYGGGYYEIAGLMQQRNGRIWAFGRAFIINYTGGERAYVSIPNEYTDEQSIQFDVAHYMFEDREGNLWITTDRAVFMFNPDAQLFNSYNLVRPDGFGNFEGPTQAIHTLPNGDIWVGCWGVGLYCFDKNMNPIAVPKSLQHGMNGYSIWAMVTHSKTGIVWIGQQDGRITTYDPKTGKAVEFHHPLLQRTIRQIAEDKDGNLWFGLQGGQLVMWNAKSGDVQSGYSLVMRKGLVHKLFVDSRGDLWVGTLGQGLFRLNTRTKQILDHFSTGNPEGKRLANTTVNDILQYNDSIYIIANSILSVLNINTKKITEITKFDGLPSEYALNLIQDKNGIIWIGMANGLCRMNFEKKIFTMYDQKDGIIYDQFNVAGAFPMADGKLAFSNDHNFLVFDPEKIVQVIAPENVVITNLMLGSKKLPMDSIIRLDKVTMRYDNNSFRIDFSALHMMKQSKIHYHYKLEGIDPDWKEATDISHVTYNYVPPGDYDFFVYAENADGVVSKQTTKLTLKVTPPFWKTWWFFALAGILAIVVLVLLDRERLGKMKALETVRTEIAGNLHHELNTTLNNINLLSEIAKIKADKDVTKSKEYIDQISDKSRRMIETMDDMLWSIEPGNDSMAKTIDRMREYADGFEKTYGLVIELQVEPRIEKLELDMKTRHELFIIFKNALNCLKQTFNAQGANITIDLEKSKLSLKLQAKRLHADMHAMNNCIFLSDIHTRAEKLNALLDIQNDKRRTSVILQVPVG